jgi:hypothetical protein
MVGYMIGASLDSLAFIQTNLRLQHIFWDWWPWWIHQQRKASQTQRANMCQMELQTQTLGSQYA